MKFIFLQRHGVYDSNGFLECGIRRTDPTQESQVFTRAGSGKVAFAPGIHVVHDLVLEGQIGSTIISSQVGFAVSHLSRLLQLSAQRFNIASMRLHQLERSLVPNAWKSTVIVAAADNTGLQEHLLGELSCSLHLVIITGTYVVQIYFHSVAIGIHLEQHSIDSICQEI